MASRSQARADEYAQVNEIPRAHGSYEALLEDPDVEAVYISLPNSLHIEWSVRALEAGKHVLCEKPLSRRPHEVERAFDIAQSSQRLFMEAFMWRHHPQTRRLTELVTQGAVGKARMIRAVFGFVASDPRNVRLSTTLDGGALMDVGCYCVSAARLIAGEPERVSAEQALGGDGVDVAFAGTMRHADDVLSHFDAGLALASRDLLEVVGDQGTLRLEDPWHCRRPGIELIRGDGSREPIEIEPRQLVPARGREPLGRDPGRGRAAARSSRRARSGPDDRGAVPGRRRPPRGDASLTPRGSRHPGRLPPKAISYRKLRSCA